MCPPHSDNRQAGCRSEAGTTDVLAARGQCGDCDISRAGQTRDHGPRRTREHNRTRDDGLPAVTEEFLAGVRSIVEPLLTELGFQLDEADDDVDEQGRKGAVVYFRSQDCRIQVYNSTRDGSIRSMIAALDAPNVFGPHDQTGKWQYLPRFALRQGIPLEQISDTNLPDFPTTSQTLEAVRARIEKLFPIAHDGILEMGGPEYWDPSS
jgi:hypothetical protein